MNNYIVIAYRWGEIPVEHTSNFKYDKDYKHYYPVGVVYSMEGGIRVADLERDIRGGKYECVVYEYNDVTLGKQVYTTDMLP